MGGAGGGSGGGGHAYEGLVGASPPLLSERKKRGQTETSEKKGVDVRKNGKYTQTHRRQTRRCQPASTRENGAP